MLHVIIIAKENIAGEQACWRLKLMSKKAPLSYVDRGDNRGISMVCSQASCGQWHGVDRVQAQEQLLGPRQD